MRDWKNLAVVNFTVEHIDTVPRDSLRHKVTIKWRDAGLPNITFALVLVLATTANSAGIQEPVRLRCCWLGGRIFFREGLPSFFIHWSALGLLVFRFLSGAQGAAPAPVPLPEQRTPLLQPVEIPGESETAAFRQALEQFSRRTLRDDFSALLNFLAEFPRGAWSPIQNAIDSGHSRILGSVSTTNGMSLADVVTSVTNLPLVRRFP